MRIGRDHHQLLLDQQVDTQAGPLLRRVEHHATQSTLDEARTLARDVIDRGQR